MDDDEDDDNDEIVVVMAMTVEGAETAFEKKILLSLFLLLSL